MSTASLLTPASAPARPQLPQLPALVVGQVTHRRPGPAPHAQRISALIRVHGIWLWLRGLPVRAHPHHTRQEGI